jgi:predicted aconitase
VHQICGKTFLFLVQDPTTHICAQTQFKSNHKSSLTIRTTSLKKAKVETAPKLKKLDIGCIYIGCPFAIFVVCGLSDVMQLQMRVEARRAASFWQSSSSSIFGFPCSVKALYLAS